MPYLIKSAPVNETSPGTKVRLDLSPITLKADQCPTPPTEFLPYNPPPGYVPGPGCAPASQGTQPSEGDPPPGYSGGSGSGSGSGSGTAYASTSAASSLKDVNPIARILGCFLPRLKNRAPMTSEVGGRTGSMIDVEKWTGRLKE